MMSPFGGRLLGSASPHGVRLTLSFTPKPSPGRGRLAPEHGVTTASPPPTLLPSALFFPPAGQPRNPGSPRLAPDTLHRPIPKRCAGTSTGGGAHVTTVHDATCASPLAALGHTLPHPVPPSAPPQGSLELWDLPQPPLSPSFLTSDTHLPSPQLSPPLPVTQRQPPTTGSPQPISPSLTSHTDLYQLPHPRQHLPPPLQLPAPLTHTPVNTHLLSSLLSGHPRRDFTSYLLQGLNIGFRVGYDGPHTARPAPNLRSSLARPQVIDSYLEAECQAGHTVGPFPSPPLPNFVINPLGAVPKKRSGNWRLIMHLSYPPGRSVNDGIDIRHFHLRYSTVSDAIDSVMRLGRGALMAKIDIKSAFRLCPVHPADHHLLGMKWKGQFYFDRVLPFGLRSAPYIFNCLADAIEWVAAQQGVAPIHHYLDDFFIAGTPDSDQCAHHLQTLTSLCSVLGVPLAEDKREGPTTCLEYLGILLDSSSLEARLPPDKLQDLHHSLQTWSTRSSCSKRELLSLIGTLSFAAKVVPAGRTFLRRMIDLSTSAASLDQVISLSQSFSLDLQWWREFATAWNGRSFFLLPHWTPAPHLQLFTDSSGTIGFGAYCQGEWFNGRWTPAQLARSIQWKELYPIVLAAEAWGHQWSTLRIRLFCDNLAITQCLVSGTSHCPHIMSLLRSLFLLAARHNFNISAQHIPGTHNIIADSLSRFRMQVFWDHAPQASPHPTPLPPSLPFMER